MEFAVVKETEVLTEANRLAAGGLRQAAIDLLKESLESSPCSPALLSALGRVYLLAREPEQAVIYLKRSLEIFESRKAAPQLSPSRDDDDFTDDDLAFIDTQAKQQSEIDYPPYDLVPAGTSHIGEAGICQIPSPSIAHIAPGNEDCKAERQDESKAEIEDRNRRRFDQEDNSSRSGREIDNPPYQKARLLSTSVSLESEPDARVISNEQSPAMSTPTARPAPTPRQDLLAQLDQDVSPFSSAKPPIQNTKRPDYEPESEPSDQWTDEILFDTPEIAHGFYEAEIYEEDSDDLVEFLPAALDDEDANEPSWGDYDNLDEFDEQAQRESIELLQAEDSITRERRARQVAADLLLGCGWQPSTIDLLQKIFIENGWGATRVAIQQEIENGLLPEELALARVIRLYWSESDHLWTTYHRIKTNTPFMEAEASYRHMSWAEALRIVRCFPALPVVEEVIELIEDTYEWWYADRRLRRDFSTFLKFLKYRTGSMRGALPGDCFFSFLEGPDSDPEIESIDLLHPITPVHQFFRHLGIQLPRGREHPPRNIMGIRKEP